MQHMGGKGELTLSSIWALHEEKWNISSGERASFIWVGARHISESTLWRTLGRFPVWKHLEVKEWESWSARGHRLVFIWAAFVSISYSTFPPIWPEKWSFKGWQPATSTTTSCPPEDQQTGERGVHSQQEKEPEGGRGEFEPTRGNQSLVLWQPQETHETCQDHSCLQGPLTVTKVTFFLILSSMLILIVQDCHPRECQYEKLHKHHKERLLLSQEDLKKVLSSQKDCPNQEIEWETSNFCGICFHL